ncbi:hypothetical protein L1987_33178 [Smallanthus sonchifolius]|uniref:Uncharacterized protein n=1 Tax=Smallanthus sonchifolius TaxID=185202 RepID=A0ACB9HQC9_9ASTR|nr:hypothetical protein L1987_33178 [Smallanthus sonchifolius]
MYAPESGNDDESADSEETDSDDFDPDAERIRATYNKKAESASGGSRRLKMMAHRKKKTRSPPYNPKVSRPKFVTKPSTTLIQEGTYLLNALFSTTTTTTTVPTSSMSTPLRSIPTSSSQVTPDTQRLLDSLINTPPIMVSTIVELKARVGSLEAVVYYVTATNFAQQQVLENQRAHSGELDVGNVEGDKGKRKQVMEVEADVSIDVDVGVSTKGDNNEKLEFVIDLDDDIFIGDWVSDDENVEIEFEQDDEGVKYATHDGFVFDATTFVNQVNEDVLEKEEGEIDSEAIENLDKKDTWSEKRKTWWKTIPESPRHPILKSKYVSKSEATERIVSWLYDDKLKLVAIKRSDYEPAL